MRAEIKNNGSTNEITLPVGMDVDQAIHALKSAKEERDADNKMTTITETIERFPFEGALAFKKACDELSGNTLPYDKMLPDGSVILAEMIAVPISFTETVQVPWGPFRLPDVEGELVTKMKMDAEGMPIFALEANVKRKYQSVIHKLVTRAKEIAEKESIYRGKAISMKFYDKKGQLAVQPPKFLDLSKTYMPIFSDNVQRKIDVNITTFIRHYEKACRTLDSSQRRSVMLQGTYGRGKTLFAYKTAQECVDAGRTFIYVEDASEYPNALLFARTLEPAMIFVEDINRVTFGPRTKEMDELLLRADGITSKTARIMTVMTTNNIAVIHPAFLREGRCDKVVDLNDTDHRSAEAVLRLYAGELLDPQESLRDVVGRAVQDKVTPAFLREVIENSKLLLLHEDPDSETYKLTAKDILVAYVGHKEERVQLATDIRQFQSDAIQFIQQNAAALGARFSSGEE